ncbi:type II toxin-antitoxin system ParD family antitoxin (plasmid) [Cereibacter azotoformans]|uniref:Type II toxin-antitoxin system ParD family antitoxin n=1 Tax=Cereibacter sphaeroides (strain ATCC 17025 / ATH 2.4.3) TaxID=349102 RepID=A4X0A8_CERS5|nr:type II toxin-antitoxin system ParD family antitoxin [Cereibacter azotoformans]AXQ96141.1 type II toxin-antitoxin system ParD family antitoxin [Cereibacter sphaeroides]UIJ32981.1 type II toxin-antitoxin system ParD family antitoxin [Cereibacter azotoformans]ULB12248.1 type II toxin-antitoxin system ParD family antitoxin [Cereibacter azotoformans]
MSRLTISMPDQMNEWVEAQIAAGRYGNVSEYFRDLVRRDQERREAAVAELRTMLERADASGVSDRSFPDILEAARREARQKGLLGDEN